MTETKKPTTRSSGTLSAEEREALRDRAKEVKAEARRGGRGGRDATAEVLAKIAEMSQPDRGLAERVHSIVTERAPGLEPKLWYGMPAYAKQGKVVVFFQSAEKFGARYATLGFNDTAALDDGVMWPTSYALTELTDDAAARIAELVERAAA